MKFEKKSLTVSEKMKIPLFFVKNNGQEDARAYFTADHKDHRLFFSSDRITVVELEPVVKQKALQYDLPNHVESSEDLRSGIALELSFIGAKQGLTPEGASKLPGKCHYFRGSDQTKWETGVLIYGELRYPAVWEGVDLEIFGVESGLKMNWVLDSPARVSSIRLHWAGADSLKLDEAGNLLIGHALGTLTDPVPYAYQETEKGKVPVGCTYRLDNDLSFGLQLDGTYDSNLPLVIDPVLQYTTYLGGSENGSGQDISVDSQGCAYVTGDTSSTDFPVTTGAFQMSLAGSRDVYITKFAPDGGSLVYSTYLGGGSQQIGYSIALDAAGCAYVSGTTTSNNFPTTSGAFQPALAGNNDAFVTKISANGDSLVYSTYLGGSSVDYGYSIAVDKAECAYVAGYTRSTNFPVTAGAFQQTYGGGTADAFVTKLAADGGNLIYSTFLGGSTLDYGSGIAVDSDGYAYVTGPTQSANFPTTLGAFQTTFNGITDSFITKLSIDGGSLVYSTFLGGSGADSAESIAVDATGRAYVTGATSSNDFPVTPGAFQTTLAGNLNVFVTLLSAAGNSLEASTYLGGSIEDTGHSITIDANGCAYVTGETNSPDFPITPAVLPSSLTGFIDAFICVLSENFSNLIVSYYLGGSGLNIGFGIAVGEDGGLYATGSTSATDFPVTPGAFQTTFDGIGSAFVTKTAFAFYQQASLTIQGLF